MVLLKGVAETIPTCTLLYRNVNWGSLLCVHSSVPSVVRKNHHRGHRGLHCGHRGFL